MDLDDLEFDVDYIGPFRVLPERAFTLSGRINYEKTGVLGEHAYGMLAVSKLIGDDLHKNVGNWYEKYFDGWRLEVVDKLKPYIEIKLKKSDSLVNLVDVGQGMNQALPIVVCSFVSRPKSLIIYEQPELHLHPAAHGDLAELFVKSAKENKQRFLIETHSENILLRIRRLVVLNQYGFTCDDVVIYWINDGEIQEITIDDKGVLSDWPQGVFTENITEITELRKVLKNKES